jgi:hypothetical protein
MFAVYGMSLVALNVQIMFPNLIQHNVNGCFNFWGFFGFAELLGASMILITRAQKKYP